MCKFIYGIKIKISDLKSMYPGLAYESNNEEYPITKMKFHGENYYPDTLLNNTDESINIYDDSATHCVIGFEVLPMLPSRCNNLPSVLFSRQSKFYEFMHRNSGIMGYNKPEVYIHE